MSEAAKYNSSWWERVNDIENRAFLCRLTRFVRARIERGATAVARVAHDPRIFAAWKQGWDADHYRKLLRMRDSCFRPAVIYDIGGHHGLWSEMSAHVFQPRVCVVFEPQADLHPIIQQRQRSGAEWQLIGVALGAANERSTLHVTDNESASSLLAPVKSAVPGEWKTNEVGHREVEVATLDSLAEQKGLPAPELVKIDVQGFEGNVIRGGGATLRKAKRIVVEVSLREIYAGQPLVAEVLAQLSALGFQLEDVTETARDGNGRLWQVDLWMTRN